MAYRSTTNLNLGIVLNTFFVKIELCICVGYLFNYPHKPPPYSPHIPTQAPQAPHKPHISQAL